MTVRTAFERLHSWYHLLMVGSASRSQISATQILALDLQMKIFRLRCFAMRKTGFIVSHSYVAYCLASRAILPAAAATMQCITLLTTNVETLAIELTESISSRIF